MIQFDEHIWQMACFNHQQVVPIFHSFHKSENSYMFLFEAHFHFASGQVDSSPWAVQVTEAHGLPNRTQTAAIFLRAKSACNNEKKQHIYIYVSYKFHTHKLYWKKITPSQSNLGNRCFHRDFGAQKQYGLRFLHLNGLAHLVRAHQLCMTGYQVPGWLVNPLSGLGSGNPLKHVFLVIFPDIHMYIYIDNLLYMYLYYI